MGFLLQCSKTLFYSVFEDIFYSTIGFSLSKLVNFILNFTYLSFILINFPLIPFFRFFLYTYQEGLKTFFCARNFFFGCVKSACFINSFNSHVMKADILILCFLMTNDVEHLNVLICQLSTFFSELYILLICLPNFQLDYFGFECSLF